MNNKKISKQNWQDGRIEPGDEDDETEVQEEEDFDPPDDNISIDEEGARYYGR